MKQFALGGAALGILLVGSTRAQAATLQFLEDGNSRVDFCLAGCVGPNVPGANSWNVDGANYLAQEWFSYRMDPDGGPYQFGPESFDAIDSTPAVSGGNGGSAMTVTYSNSWIEASIEYTLSGGLPGSNTSHLHETVVLTNKRSEDFFYMNLFQYSDFDMCGTHSNDDVNIGPGDGGTTVATQTPSASCLPISMQSQTIVTDPSRVEASDNIPAGNLNNDTSFSNGDAKSAFQWTVWIPSANTAIETHNPWANVRSFDIDKTIAPVPEPMSMLLVGTGLLTLGRAARRRVKSTVA